MIDSSGMNRNFWSTAESTGLLENFMDGLILQIIKNDLVLKMTPENRSKTFHNESKA